MTTVSVAVPLNALMRMQELFTKLPDWSMLKMAQLTSMSSVHVVLNWTVSFWKTAVAFFTMFEYVGGGECWTVSHMESMSALLLSFPPTLSPMTLSRTLGREEKLSGPVISYDWFVCELGYVVTVLDPS